MHYDDYYYKYLIIIFYATKVGCNPDQLFPRIRVECSVDKYMMM